VIHRRYDAFQALAKGTVDLVVNEPLPLVERRALQLTSHGCFFATDGGMLMQRTASAQGGALRPDQPCVGQNLPE